MDKDQVSRYKEAYCIGSELPLIEIFIIDGVLYLVDGFHRITALDQIAVEKAQVDFSVMAQVRTGTWAEAEIFAADANVRHGYPLSKRRYSGRCTQVSAQHCTLLRRDRAAPNIHHTTVLRLDRKEKIRSTAAETVTYERSDEGEVVVKQIETAAAPGDAGAVAGAPAGELRRSRSMSSAASSVIRWTRRGSASHAIRSLAKTQSRFGSGFPAGTGPSPIGRPNRWPSTRMRRWPRRWLHRSENC